ncbi:MAG: SGNH/GDSL hydrolase family protein [Desulforhopalus sp.]
MKSKCRPFFTAVVLVLFFSPASIALGYSSIVSLGDSLSDNGNVSRFTDGPLWVELLADHYSAPLFDIAHGGATTGYDNPRIGSPITGLQWQVEQFPSLPGDSLVTLWAGANDLLQSRSPLNAVYNIDFALENLYLAGGRNFLVPNLPDIGSSPSLVSEPVASEEATFWTLIYNSSLENTLHDFNDRHTDVELYLLDVFTIFEQYPVGTPEWLELFWVDGFHPSSLGHQKIFEAALATVEPVPEPSTLLLFGIGIVGLIGVRLGRHML